MLKNCRSNTNYGISGLTDSPASWGTMDYANIFNDVGDSSLNDTIAAFLGEPETNNGASADSISFENYDDMFNTTTFAHRSVVSGIINPDFILSGDGVDNIIISDANSLEPTLENTVGTIDTDLQFINESDPNSNDFDLTVDTNSDLNLSISYINNDATNADQNTPISSPDMTLSLDGSSSIADISIDNGMQKYRYRARCCR